MRCRSRKRRFSKTEQPILDWCGEAPSPPFVIIDRAAAKQRGPSMGPPTQPYSTSTLGSNPRIVMRCDCTAACRRCSAARRYGAVVPAYRGILRRRLGPSRDQPLQRRRWPTRRTEGRTRKRISAGKTLANVDGTTLKQGGMKYAQKIRIRSGTLRRNSTLGAANQRNGRGSANRRYPIRKPRMMLTMMPITASVRVSAPPPNPSGKSPTSGLRMLFSVADVVLGENDG